MLRALAFLGTALAVWLAAIATGHAETIGWRIEARACRGTVCRTLPASARSIGVKYVCTTHAAALARAAELVGARELRLPAGPWRVTVECVAIEGMPRA